MEHIDPTSVFLMSCLTYLQDKSKWKTGTREPLHLCPEAVGMKTWAAEGFSQEIATRHWMFRPANVNSCMNWVIHQTLHDVNRSEACISTTSVPTSVWTIDRRWERISDTMPRMSANSCSLMCCIRRSRAMNVPVLPTPALRNSSSTVNTHKPG